MADPESSAGNQPPEQQTGAERAGRIRRAALATSRLIFRLGRNQAENPISSGPTVEHIAEAGNQAADVEAGAYADFFEERQPEAAETAEEEAPSEEIIEDTGRAVSTEPSDEDTVESYLKKAGVDKDKRDKVAGTLSRDRGELIRLYLDNLGVPPDRIEAVANVLTPLHLYLKKLHELGMPATNDKEAHRVLVEEKGRLRLLHLNKLVGGREQELGRLMASQQMDLMDDELKEMGFHEAEIEKILATPRRNRYLLREAIFKKMGLGAEVIRGIELTAAMEEIPVEVIRRAHERDISLVDVAKAREAFNHAGWEETFDFLELAQSHQGARERLKQHNIEIGTYESEEELEQRVSAMSLKNINEAEKDGKLKPGTWEAERARRIAKKRIELTKMFEDFKEYLPRELAFTVEDLEDEDIPPEVGVPKRNHDEPVPTSHDVLAAYGLWKRLITTVYERRLSDKATYRSVRSELRRVGGPIPVLRGIRQRLLAVRILQAEKRRHEHGNYGALGMGLRIYREYLRSIEEADIQVKNARNALSLQHRRNFIARGQDTPRKKLADTIVDIKLQEVAYQKGRLNPEIPRP